MKAPSTKQLAYAASLHARHCNALMDTCKRHNLPIPTIRRDYRDEMAWLELNVESARDVSEFISMHIDAKTDAAMSLGMRPR